MNYGIDNFMCTTPRGIQTVNNKVLRQGLLAGAVSLFLSACSSIPDENISGSQPSDWGVNPVVDDAGTMEAVELPSNIGVDAIFTGDISDDMAMAKDPQPVKVAVTRKNPARDQKKRPTRIKSKAMPIEIVAPACAKPFTGRDETIVLATTDSLKLRRGPSTSAAILAVLSPGTTVTARKLTCGNWTEIVDGKRPIGYVHSYFLSAP